MTGQSSHARLEFVFPPDPFNLTPTPDIAGLERFGYVGDTEAYISSDLKEEVARAQARGGLALGAVYHGTSSGALPGIALHGSILSSSRLIELGCDVTTGEISEPQGSIHRATGGLEDIFACHDPVNTSYAFNKEGEYPVIFGIHDAKVRDAHSDGLKLGSRVPLSSVVSLTVPYEQLSPAEAWAEAHCQTGAIVVSREAAIILSIAQRD